jgi:hypothetical protein
VALLAGSWAWLRARLRIRRRIEAAEQAALVASLDHPGFEPAAILRTANAELDRITGHRRGDDIGHLRRLVGRAHVDALLALATSKGPADPADVHVRVSRRPKVAIVGVRPPDGSRDGEAVVLVRMRARSWVGRFGYAAAFAMTALRGMLELASWTLADTGSAEARRVRVYWVLRQAGAPGELEFSRFELAPGGRHRLSEPLEDLHMETLRDASVLEVAGNLPSNDVTIPREIASGLPEDPRAALLDLAGVDGCFTLDVIAVAVRRLLAQWARASEGDAHALDTLADARAVSQLLHPPDFALRTPALEEVRPHRVRALRVPPEVVVELKVRAWYGPRDPGEDPWQGTRRTRTYWWRLARQPSPEHPWRLLDADAAPSRPQLP